MNRLEAAILFLLRHVASHADGPTAKQAQKHLDAVEQVFAPRVPEDLWTPLHGAEETIARCRPIIYVENDKPDESHPAGDIPLTPTDQTQAE